MEAIGSWARWQRFHGLHRGPVELDVAEMEAQFELVATGLILSDNKIHELFRDDAQALITLLTPFPPAIDDVRRFHFTLVASSVLLDEYLQLIESSEAQATLLLAGKLTTDVLLPLRGAPETAKDTKDQEALKKLFTTVQKLLKELLELLQQENELMDESMQVCEMATSSWRQRPEFLRAVALHLVPKLLEDKDEVVYQRLLTMVLDAWDPLQTTFPQELLYLVCIMMPKAPRASHSKVAFSHCAMMSESKKKGEKEAWVGTWQSFLTASEVIQMHHEQHLIEQVWPQVAGLLTNCLIVHVDTNKQKSEQWPVQLTFDWMQSLLVRLFAHEPRRQAEKESVLDEYVDAIEEAIFGQDADNHSPEALLSMLQVFQSPYLKRAAVSTSKMTLSAAAVDRLRFLLDVHAMQSFSQAMRTKMLRALSHALTGGFVSVSSLSLLTLARVLCVFPMSALVATMTSVEKLDNARLVLLIAKFEDQVQELVDSCQSFTFSFQREAFYTGYVNCAYLFESAMAVARSWLDNEMQSGDHEKEDTMERVVSAVSVVVQMTAKCLSIITTNAAAIDSLRAFESERMLPLLLALDTSRRYSGKLDARCAISLASSKWALPTAGMDPSALIHMVNVLSLTLSQLAGSIANTSNGVDQLDNLLDEVWAAYNDSKAKPDALSRAVVMCMFQPVFLLRAELKATMKHWIAEFIRFGSRHRPNVIFHLACRLCQTWRAHPVSALSFVDELVELLLYKEPLIDEKEQLTMDTSAPFQGFQGFSPVDGNQTAAITTHAKDRFVRLIMLSFLDDMLSIEALRQKILSSLWMHYSLNSFDSIDGFGKKLRSWQALCIVSAHVNKTQLTELLPTLHTAFAVPQLPSVRYYMELFGMRIATKFPREICSGLLLPMLCDANLMPQVGASLLLVSAYLVDSKLDDNSLDIDCGELLETMLPWLNTSHGYTRVLAQYLLAKVLPRHIHQLQLSSNDTPGLHFLEGTARYLSNNKECKRMLRRQARQLEEFHPDYESSLLGMLSSGFISEFGELLPRDEALRFSEQLKTAMNGLYAQYQLENFTPTPSQDKNSDETGSSSGNLTVQRKIDTTALLLEDSALPAAMRADFDAARRGVTLNARQRPRQPLIMCASLVDKIPNLAGLARTCEIFNAQKLIVPNIRMAQQDATFATVSATAHKWMPLEEVRPQGDDLRQALLRWKREGYTIVAVEQTASSVSLADYTLPRKMVLVLGREKEGIPVEVLQLVDVCVEIPQFGLVRSLNVHYTQQQLMSGALESTL
ncbi:Alpha/beta knot methyltransferase [Phytophthora cactorum]|nr:Alpha/beta knot methyltransferase [Phytophthora cactorum]